MNRYQSEEYSVINLRLGDLCIHTVPDKGFYQRFDMSPQLHSHIYYELFFSVKDGFFLDFSEPEDRMEIGEGELCLLQPGVYHGTRPCTEHSKKLALRFRYFRLEENVGKGESLYEIFHKAMCSYGKADRIEGAEQLRELFDRIRQEILSPGVGSDEYIRALLGQLFLLLIRMVSKNSKDTDTSRGELADEEEMRRIRIEEYFQKNFQDPITEEHMASRFNLSKRQLSRVMRRIYGKSFRQVLTEERLNRAAQMLLSSDRSVEAIAAEVGYTSLSGFYSAFRAFFGTTAGQYRKMGKI
jgi:AraC-like DNA-binding protein